MLRKIIILLILFLWSIYYPSAEAQSPSNKRVVIFYAVSDGVISCQNSDGDLAKGKKQFEDTVRNNYKKRFVVDDIRLQDTEQIIKSNAKRCSLTDSDCTFY